MYNGSNQTALASQKNIADAFVALLRTEAYSKISISAICREAGVSRQTFYSLFESKENIVLYLLDKRHTFNPEERCSCTGITLSSMSTAYSQYIFERKEFLSLLAQNDLIYLLHDSLCSSLLNCTCFLDSTDDLTRSFAAEFIASGLSGIVRTFIQKGAGMSQEELGETICLLFAGEFLNGIR